MFDKNPFLALPPELPDLLHRSLQGTVANLLKPENKDQLAAILKYHVLPGRVYSADAANADRAETLLGKSIHINGARKGLQINDARVVKADIDASNGVIHVVDEVILPNK